jgi:hypothetical protein
MLISTVKGMDLTKSLKGVGMINSKHGGKEMRKKQNGNEIVHGNAFLVAERGCAALDVKSNNIGQTIIRLSDHLRMPAELSINALSMADEVLEQSRPAGGRGSRRRSHGCLRAWVGVMRASGSQSRHRFRKSKNRSSACKFT